MTEIEIDVFKLIELTKRSDPVAFRMREDANGFPAGFVDHDESRRSAAFSNAYAHLKCGRQGSEVIS